MSGITIKTAEEIEKLREGGKILATIMEGLINALRPGITTLQLDKLARDLMKSFDVKPSFLNFGEPPYPAAICASVNEEVVHSVPSERLLKNGDIIGLDIGIWHLGLCTDMARTAPIGEVSDNVKKLLKVTEQALFIAQDQVKPGAHIGDIGEAVQTYVEKHGFSVVKKLVGHGVGYEVHEEPRIPNFGKKGEGPILKEGMVLALEPMVNQGTDDIAVRANDWDIITKDGLLSAHFENTLAVTKSGALILTER